MPLGFDPHHPGGMADNSPTFQPKNGSSTKDEHRWTRICSLLPRPRDKRHRAPPHPSPLPFGRGEGEASAALGSSSGRQSAQTSSSVLPRRLDHPQGERLRRGLPQWLSVSIGGFFVATAEFRLKRFPCSARGPNTPMNGGVNETSRPAIMRIAWLAGTGLGACRARHRRFGRQRLAVDEVFVSYCRRRRKKSLIAWPAAQTCACSEAAD